SMELIDMVLDDLDHFGVRLRTGHPYNCTDDHGTDAKSPSGSHERDRPPGVRQLLKLALESIRREPRPRYAGTRGSARSTGETYSSTVGVSGWYFPPVRV